MDYLEEPGVRQRAMSVASILTNTMEGMPQQALPPSRSLSLLPSLSLARSSLSLPSYNSPSLSLSLSLLLSRSLPLCFLTFYVFLLKGEHHCSFYPLSLYITMTCTMFHYFPLTVCVCVCINTSLLIRAGGVQTEVSSLLVQVCQHVPDLGLLPSVAEGQGDREHGGHGSVCGPSHHHLHCAQHPVHGHGALPHDQGVQQRAVSGEPGERAGDTLEPSTWGVRWLSGEGIGLVI